MNAVGRQLSFEYSTIIRLHRIPVHEVQRCGLLLPTFRGLSVCPLDITTNCAKMPEPIEMPFGSVGSCIRWGQGLPGEGTFLPADKYGHPA